MPYSKENISLLPVLQQPYLRDPSIVIYCQFHMSLHSTVLETHGYTVHKLCKRADIPKHYLRSRSMRKDFGGDNDWNGQVTNNYYCSPHKPLHFIWISVFMPDIEIANRDDRSA